MSYFLDMSTFDTPIVIVTTFAISNVHNYQVPKSSKSLSIIKFMTTCFCKIVNLIPLGSTTTETTSTAETTSSTPETTSTTPEKPPGNCQFC